jgi:hypothetical protein
MDFSIKEITSLTSNFTWRKWFILSTDWCQGYKVLVDKMLTLGHLETIAIFKLSVVLKDAYSTGILQVLYHSIGIHFILLHVELEDGLSISVWKKRATRHKNLELGDRKVTKKVKRRLFYFMCRLFQTLVCHRSNLAYRCMSELPKWLKHIQQSVVMKMVWSRFYSLYETMVKLYVGLANEWLLWCNELRNEEGKSWSAVPKVSVVVAEGSELRNSTF